MITFEDIMAELEALPAPAPVQEKPAAIRLPKAPPPPEPDNDDVPADTQAILAATDKLLAVSRGQADPDERDSLEYRRVYTPDKLFAERIDLDADKIMRTTMRRLAKLRSLKAVGVSHFDPYTEGLIVSNPLSSPLEEINPMHLVEQARRITQLGPGGLGEDSISPEMQNVHPSQFGFISAIEGPECFREGTQVMTDMGWKDWQEVTLNTRLACWNENMLQFHKAERVIVKQSYTGPMIGVQGPQFKFSVTPNHKLWARPNVNGSHYELRDASELYGGEWCFCIMLIMNCERSGAVVNAIEVPAGAPRQGVAMATWYQEEYLGPVYCATVPGGMLFTKYGDSLGFWSGNSSHIGVDTRLAWGTKIGSDGNIYQRFRNPKTQRFHWLAPGDLTNRVVGLPD